MQSYLSIDSAQIEPEGTSALEVEAELSFATLAFSNRPFTARLSLSLFSWLRHSLFVVAESIAL